MKQDTQTMIHQVWFDDNELDSQDHESNLHQDEYLEMFEP